MIEDQGNNILGGGEEMSEKDKDVDQPDTIKVDFSQGGNDNRWSGPTEESGPIKVDFSRSGETPAEPSMPRSGRSQRSVSGRSPMGLFHILLAPKGVDRMRWSEAMNKAENEIAQYLQSLSGQTSRAAYHDSFAIIQKLSNEDLMSQVLDSGEADWQSKPAYYKALAEEMIVRFRGGLQR